MRSLNKYFWTIEMSILEITTRYNFQQGPKVNWYPRNVMMIAFNASRALRQLFWNERNSQQSRIPLQLSTLKRPQRNRHRKTATEKQHKVSPQPHHGVPAYMVYFHAWWHHQDPVNKYFLDFLQAIFLKASKFVLNSLFFFFDSTMILIQASMNIIKIIYKVCVENQLRNVCFRNCLARESLIANNFSAM